MSVKDGDTYTLKVKNYPTFNVSTVISPEARKKGLSGRSTLASGTGLLFIFDVLSYQSMWMPDMNFALDIIWLDENMRVVNANYNVQPCETDDCPSYPSVKLVKYAIEMRAGDANKYGLVNDSEISVI
jgi:hypothetical protein